MAAESTESAIRERELQKDAREKEPECRQIHEHNKRRSLA